MGMVGGIRLINAIASATISAAQLETELTSGGLIGEWEQALSIRGQCRLVARSANAMSRVLGSATARGNVFANSIMVQEMSLSPVAMSAIANSAATMASVVADDNLMAIFARSRVAMEAIYAVPATITTIMPTAWAVYAPHPGLITITDGAVSGWTNAQGTTTRNLSQTTAINRPRVSAFQNIANYSPINFDSNDVLNAGQALNRTQYTIYAVVRRNDTTNGLIGDTTGNDGLGFTSNTPTLFNFSNGGTGGSSSIGFGTAHDTGRWFLVTYRCASSSNLWVSINALNELSLAMTNIPDFGTDPLTIGRGFVQAAASIRSFDGDIAEMIITTQGAIRDVETTRITNLLLRKYGLA